MTVADLTLDTKTCKVTRSGREIKLLPKEMALLEFLVRHKGQYFTVDQLLNKVWSSESEATALAVRQTVKRLRDRLEQDKLPSLINTRIGIGYAILDVSESSSE